MARGKEWAAAAPSHGLRSLSPRGGFARLLSPGEQPCPWVGESMPFQKGAGFSRLPALGLGLPAPHPKVHVASRGQELGFAVPGGPHHSSLLWMEM